MRKFRLWKKLKQDSAFSLQEMLVTVAVIVVLITISVPMISDLVLRLRMTELDNYAKTIFLEAQNQLVAQEVEGGLPRFYEDIKDNYADHFLTVMPHDYDTEKNGDKWKQLCYLIKTDAAAKVLIPEITNSYQLGGNYLIELNPQTGDIYGVFYWKKDEAINYSEHILTLLDRTQDERSSIEIGYYGGQMESTISAGFTLDQDIELVNDEELYLKISFEHSARLLKYYNSGLNIQYVIEDEHDNTFSGSISGSQCVIGERLECYLLIDSMTEGYGFSDIFGGKLIAGDNLSITITTTFKQGASRYGEESEPIRCNSLFADKSGLNEDTILQIAKLRHLRNLDVKYYTHTAEAGGVSIVLSGDIDFETKSFAWDEGTYVGRGNANRPIEDMSPIQNAVIFENSSADITTVNGGGFEIRNMLINAASSYAGLFASGNYVNFYNIRLEDLTVNAAGYNYVGALVGSLKNGKIENCGVYLSTYTEENGTRNYYSDHIYASGAYKNEMEERYDKLAVFGNNYVGGLAGVLENCQVTDSFAAVAVNGYQTVGGFAGRLENTTAATSYASGKVWADGAIAGGFAGASSGVSIANAYSTSDVTAETMAGGFVGTSDENGQYTSCIAYGLVLSEDGENPPTNAGGFVSAAGGSDSNNTYTNCTFLQQDSYNARGMSDPDSIRGSSFNALKATEEEVIGEKASYPYKGTLVGKNFPFVPVVESHYGDWPIRYAINTSLVYFERYANGEYGYYCVTTLSDNEDSSQYVWVLDSLQDRECVEDGYALLSDKSLSSFSYQLDINSDGEDLIRKNLTVSETELGNDYAALMRQQSALTFEGYSGTNLDIHTDFSVLEPSDEFSVDGMYLYQLPYDLQLTVRDNTADSTIKNFYDEIIIYNGIESGLDIPTLGGAAVTDGENQVFYYCSHFAKNAINAGKLGELPANRTAPNNPQTGYVRSARQLNALGRYNTYWNTTNGAYSMKFIQETDINFGTYTTTYCGQNFNLMDTSSSNALRNQPIGQPAGTTGGQFKNSYDGQGNKIIDYRVESSYQFVGLFGEICGAEIRNVIMTVSSRGTGYIYSTYNEANSTAVGALVGLSYEDASDSAEDGENIIENCAASGYVVKYTTPSNNIQVLGISAGGLIGFSMDDVAYCAVDNDVILDVRNDFRRPITMGGLIGSAYYGIVEKSYAGGTITIITNGNTIGSTNTTDNIAIGGVCGGILKIYNDYSGAATATYRNLYSYTTIKVDSSTNYDSKIQYFPVVGKYVVGIINQVGPNFTNVNSQVTYSDCYYLSGLFGETIAASAGNNTALTLEQMSNPNFTIGVTGDAHVGRVDGVDTTYPLAETLQGQGYPFATVVTVTDTYVQDYEKKSVTYAVHFGDWPVDVEDGGSSGDGSGDGGTEEEYQRNDEVANILLYYGTYAGLFYYEYYVDGTYGIYAVGYDNDQTYQVNVINTLAETGLEVVESGYGIFYKKASGGLWRTSNDRNWGWNTMTSYVNNKDELKELGSLLGIDYEFYVIDKGDFNGSYSRYIRYGNNGTRKQVTLDSGDFTRP